MIAQSGQEQFMYIRTQGTPNSVDAVKLNDQQNERMYELMDEGYSFKDASRIAAEETAKKYKLAYYEGSGGKFVKTDW
ncbi:hypothetical protein MAH1_31560 [Sessilibacter sp. MAH1]